jgi:hypothetical protein
MALVDGTGSGIGYGKAPTPAPAAPFWDASVGAYRDPVSGRVAVGSDAAGWRWVTDAEYRAMFAGKAEDWGNVPDIMAGALDTLTWDDPVRASSGQVYPVANPFAGMGRVSPNVQPTGQINVDDRRYAAETVRPMPVPTPAPMATPLPVQVIGGQIARLPR